MTKICPNCKTENPDNSVFCQNCGTELKGTPNTIKSDIKSGGESKGWWSKQSTGIKAVIGIVGVCFLGLIIFIAIGGILSPDQNLNSNFSNGGITFNYPNDWNNATSSGSIVSGGSSLVDLGTLANSNGLTLHISKADISSAGGITIAVMKDVSKKNLLNGSSAQLLSDNKTSVNGLTVYETSFTLKDPKSNQDQKSLFVITGKDKQTVYYMQFIADTSTFDQNQNLINRIIGTIKIQ